MAATYPGGVKSFTTRVAGQTIQPAHTNDLQDEVNAVEDALINGFSHNLTPAINGARSVGSSSKRWGDAMLVQLTLYNSNNAGLVISHSVNDLTDGHALIIDFADGGGAPQSRTLTMTGDATINQNTATTGTPQFARVGIGTAATSVNQALVGGSLTPGAGNSAALLGVTGTVVEAGSGVHALVASVSVAPPTVTAGAATMTNAATVYISNQPAASVTGANYALWVDAGIARVDGQFQFRGVIAATLAAGQTNDWAPTGLSDCNTIDVTADAGGTSAISGLTAQPDGTTITLRNVSAFAFGINPATGSSAANQFAGGAAGITVNAGRAVAIQYVASITKWVALVPA